MTNRKRVMSDEDRERKLNAVRALAKLPPSKRAEIIKKALENRGLHCGQRSNDNQKSFMI